MSNKRDLELLFPIGMALALPAFLALSACSSTSHPSATPGAAEAASRSSEPPALLGAFEVSKGQLPEGLAVADGVPYVGLAPTGQIAKVSLADGSLSEFATLPTPVPNRRTVAQRRLPLLQQVTLGASRQRRRTRYQGRELA